MDAGLAAHGHGWPIAAGPRSRTGVRVCRAWARHRTKGARAFGYFAPGGVPFFKVTRCKSETNRSRDRRNGYVHQQKIRRRSDRHRERAHFHSLNRVHQGSTHRLSDRHREQARLLQFDPGTSGNTYLAVRATSLASQLPQFDPGNSEQFIGYETAIANTLGSSFTAQREHPNPHLTIGNTNQLPQNITYVILYP